MEILGDVFLPISHKPKSKMFCFIIAFVVVVVVDVLKRFYINVLFCVTLSDCSSKEETVLL